MTAGLIWIRRSQSAAAEDSLYALSDHISDCVLPDSQKFGHLRSKQVLNPGSARGSLAGDGAPPSRTFNNCERRCFGEGAETGTRGHVRSPECPRSNARVSLRAFFEGGGNSLQMRERFTGEMQ